MALAWQAELDGQCGGCGHPASESQDPANEGRYTGHGYRCFACQAQAAKAAEFSKTGDTAGMHFWSSKDGEG